MVGFIAEATNLQWSFAVIALMSTIIIFNVAKISDAGVTTGDLTAQAEKI